MNHLIISGFGGSGKSTLLYLLDSEDFLPSFTHDKTIFHVANSNEILANCNSRSIRRILCSSMYYNFELVSLNKEISIPISSKLSSTIPIKFNFKDFDSNIINGILNLEILNKNTIVDEIFLQYARELKSNPSYIMHLGLPYAKYDSITLNTIKNSMIIYVKRNYAGILATKINRQYPANAPLYKRYIPIITETLMIFKIVKYEFEIEKLLKKYPARVLIIDFTDLIKKPKDTLLNVANFLNHKIENQNLSCSLLRTKICENEMLLWNENDRALNYFTFSKRVYYRILFFSFSLFFYLFK